jgi:predicted transcriptional regulator
VKTHIATTVDDDLLAELNELAETEERSVASIIRRSVRRELAEHRRSTQLLINGRTRSQQGAKRKQNRRRVVAAA